MDLIIFQFDERAILSCHATFATQARVEGSFESLTILRLKRGYIRAWFKSRAEKWGGGQGGLSPPTSETGGGGGG